MTAEEHSSNKGYTPPKGRPTPKRNVVERDNGRRRGPYTPPETRAERRARLKEFKKTHTKEEIKALKRQEREERRKEARRVQKAIDDGDERYLLDRDKGETRRFARDYVDSRRYLNNFVMPAALILLVVLFISTSIPSISYILSTIATVIIFIFFIEGFWIGYRAGKAAKAKFPEHPDTGLALRFYAYSRATQPRRWRSPKPRVEIAQDIS